MSARPPVAAVAVVVPAHDEQDRIAACLTSLEAAVAHLTSTRAGVRTLVVVALDRCTDGTAAVAARHAAVTVELEAGCVGTARRTGVAAAAALLGEPDSAAVLVVNTDADCVVPADWLTDLVALAEHGSGTDPGGCDLVLGEVSPDPAEMGARALAEWWARHPVGRGSLHGANLAVRLSSYLAAGGFDELADREDAALVRALRRGGARVVGGTRVHTSARRDGRVPKGFAGYLRTLDAELAADDPHP